MLNTKKVLLLVCMWAVLPVKALGLDLNGQLFDPENLVSEDLDKEQIRLNMLNNRADEIMLTHGRYKLVRSQYLYSDKGVVKLSEDYFSALTAWLNGLDAIRASLVSIENLTSVENRDAIRTSLDVLMNDFSDISLAHDTVRKRGLLALEHLDLTRNFPEGYISEYDATLTAYSGHRTQLVASINEILGSVDVALKDSLRQTLSVTQEIFEIFLMQSAVSAGSEALRDALELANGMLEAELLIKPLTSEIFSRKLRAANLLGVHHKRFSAEKLYLETSALADSYLVQINSFDTLPEQEKADGINEINELVNDIRLNIDNDDSSNSGKWYHVYMLYDKANTEIVPLCASGIGLELYNCQSMRSIQGLTLFSIVSLDDAQLEYLEDTLIAVENGPLASGG